VTHVDHPEGALRTRNVADELATATGPMTVVIVTPSKPIYEGEATHLVVPSAAGQLGIWPRHTDLVSALGIGRLRLRTDPGHERKYAVWGGFLKIGRNRVTILVDRAVHADDVDVAKTRAELDEVLAALRHPKSDEEFQSLLDRRRWCEVCLKIAS
jgi:F-type H+-transporting ATPase subunit epsilon